MQLIGLEQIPPTLLVCMCAISSSISYAQMSKVNGIIAMGESYQTEYFILSGKSTNPVVMVDGGIHGDEIAGILTADSLKNLTISKGSLIIIPRMNIKACSQNIRYENIEFNHCFPGKQNAKFYEDMLAYELTQFVLKHKPDYILSLHESRFHRKQLNDKSGGQVIYFGTQNQPKSLQNLVASINRNLSKDQAFLPIYYPVNGACSEVWNSLYGCEAYAIETWRGYPLSLRVKFQEDLVMTFLKQVGIEFTP